MMEQEFIEAGYTVVGTKGNENKLLSFLKEHYPSIIKDNEINLNELKDIAGLPIDEKVNGYGLNFVGRNFARAKYAQKTGKELFLNTTLSKEIDATENLVLKGDNLDSLKILKNYYTGKIKCIYIDPPYNTTSDEFVYPDKFDKEEAEVLGLVNLSESDYDRMDFSFKTKKSHNGWLAFMYPRLLLARDLLSKDGVIFISIDDNEQANLKLLCDDVFGEENFVNKIVWKKNSSGKTVTEKYPENIDYLLMYSKSQDKVLRNIYKPLAESTKKMYSKDDGDGRGKYRLYPLQKTGGPGPETTYDYIDNSGKIWKCPEKGWRMVKEKLKALENDNRLVLDGKSLNEKAYWNERDNEGQIADTLWDDIAENNVGTSEVDSLVGKGIFTNPKPTELIRRCINTIIQPNDIILDFFAGSGTTGHAVMQLNAEDGGNRKFILCQIDEPIKKGKPAYQFCIDNNLPPVISSITIERLKRAGEKIEKEIEAENDNVSMFDEYKKQVPDTGFKVFDSVEAPKLEVDEKGQISITFNECDDLSRIYNMIFTVGLDEPTQVPEIVMENCIYKIGNHYYITNSEKISSDDFAKVIRSGKVFIDGWTASLNGTLQNYKEDLKIVF
ncbi:MAG: site-specific DNA-methyltransferase [Candidatus Cloacimonetes bacterium]|nr:site-specific DNA-methyltransferase [Candidatus Cloacimonadota bacterium]